MNISNNQTIFSLFLFFLIITSTGIKAAAATNAGKPVQKPVLVLLGVAKNTESLNREQRLLTELKLALDGFHVQMADIADEDFLILPLSSQLKKTRIVTDKYNAVATIWIGDAGSNIILLHLVSLSTGQALVRIIEARRGTGNEKELALIARELLGEAYIFSPIPSNAAMKDVVTKVHREIVMKMPLKKHSRWAVTAMFKINGGLMLNKGSSLRMGGDFGVKYWPVSNFFLSGFVYVQGDPVLTSKNDMISGFNAASFGVEMGYGWHRGMFFAGPVFGSSFHRSKLEIAPGNGLVDAFSWWSIREYLGVSFQIRVAKQLALTALFDTGIFSLRKKFKRLPDKSVLVNTPLIDFSTAVGIAMFF